MARCTLEPVVGVVALRPVRRRIVLEPKIEPA